MTMTVLVGSKKNGSVYQVEGQGTTETDARRNAIQLGRALHHIGDPIALTEHEAAVRMRQTFLAANRPNFTGVNGRGTPLSARQEVPHYR